MIQFVLFQIAFVIILVGFIIRQVHRARNSVVNKDLLLINDRTSRTVSEYWNINGVTVDRMALDLTSMIRLNGFNQVQLFNYALNNYNNVELLVCLFMVGRIHALEIAEKELEAKMVSMQMTSLMLSDITEYRDNKLSLDAGRKAKVLKIIQLIGQLQPKEHDALTPAGAPPMRFGDMYIQH